MDVPQLPTAEPQGPLRRRLDSTNTWVAILPATCRPQRHALAATGYRAVLRDGVLDVVCTACTAEHGAAPHWRLTTDGPACDRAELDDAPYRDLVAFTLRRTPAP
ncbi:hypothetical protein ACQPZF_36300 [Actinosynnema sp. CS-041913]|uniref:hypothetical protein n=1 Tax=Actinosynnema sp. CS-041913 TaxID=3239917 RepID=UPI003D919F9C